jgi:molybdate transport system substrate-binding protein
MFLKLLVFYYFFFNIYFITKYYTLKVAIAFNFTSTFFELQSIFKKRSFLNVNCIYGSTGHLYTQISNGLFIDFFFSADFKRPYNLFLQKKVFKEFINPYANGNIVFWSSFSFVNYFEYNSIFVLFFNNSMKNFKLVVPNFSSSPYGTASLYILKKSLTYNVSKKCLIFGESINQAFMYINSKYLFYGFSSLTQILNFNRSNFERFIFIFPFLFQKNLEQMISIMKTQNFIFSRCLFEFTHSYIFAKIVCSFGYTKKSNLIFLLQN